MPGNHNEIEKRLWDAADELRANSALNSSEYSVPVLGLIFLRYADQGKHRSRRFKVQDLRGAIKSRKILGKLARTDKTLVNNYADQRNS